MTDRIFATQIHPTDATAPTLTLGALRNTIITYLQAMARSSKFTVAECQQFEDVANLLERGPK